MACPSSRQEWMIAMKGISSERRTDTTVVVLAVVVLVWVGLLLGVSFLATPVKFLAPSLTLPVALDVGRQTFRWFSRVELVLAAATLLAALVHDGRRGLGAISARGWPLAALLSAGLLAAVLLQMLWLLPLLDARVEVILQGRMPPPSRLHDVYVAIEAMKLGALVGLGWRAMSVLVGASKRWASGGA